MGIIVTLKKNIDVCPIFATEGNCLVLADVFVMVFQY